MSWQRPEPNRVTAEDLAALVSHPAHGRFDLTTNVGRLKARRAGFDVPKFKRGWKASGRDWQRSVCSMCDVVVDRPYRKYCDACWKETMKSGRCRKVDANQGEIVDALRAIGCCVEDMSSAGGGFPDLLIWSPFLKSTLLAEVKNLKAHGRLNKKQIAWHANWRGQVAVITNVDEALRLVGAPVK